METKPTDGQSSDALLHRTWMLCILLKGIHAVVEVASAAVVWLVKPGALEPWLRALAKSELAEDPHDYLVNWMLRTSGHYSADVQRFTAIYLLAIGLVNLTLVVLLWRKKRWAYLFLVTVLLLFIAYQMVRWTRTHGAFLIVLSLLDLLTIWLALKEYRKIKVQLAPH